MKPAPTGGSFCLAARFVRDRCRVTRAAKNSLTRAHSDARTHAYTRVHLQQQIAADTSGAGFEHAAQKLAGAVGVGGDECDQLVDAAAETTNARRS